MGKKRLTVHSCYTFKLTTELIGKGLIGHVVLSWFIHILNMMYTWKVFWGSTLLNWIVATTIGLYLYFIIVETLHIGSHIHCPELTPYAVINVYRVQIPMLAGSTGKTRF